MARASSIYQEEVIPSPLRQIWLNFMSYPVAQLGLWTFLLFLFIAIFAPFLAPYPPDYQHTNALLSPPSWHPDGNIAYFFGTDDLGRDIFSNLLHGVRTTFGSSLIVTIFAAIFGIALGVFSGMSRGLKSSILNHVLDATLAIPSLLLAIVLVAISGQSLINVMIAVGIALMPQFMRATHTAVHHELSREYVIAAKLDGANQFQIFYNVILPNILDALIVQFTLAISIAIIDIATLGFLKIGAPAPTSELGAMLVDGIDLIFIAPWNVTFPGLAIFISVLAINLVGYGLQRAVKEGLG
ncbi:ABC transporter permease subunit [Psychrobium sp. 1_MG-2023]|uniref:ABC transporter permease subunit n=1 Tax=Psychrobium sp. 1_MG-2023 TaxID=3062624 RepID=UPI000C33A5F1|nr:ABC transporter permease subunit [Psychrobium sp. 1_MG-2023]MDP2562430.1 ABC transporter permease subunit [Psychrobium sp. 1_MG-2023]PKF56158.1 peptide ABC transporter permease [Alteromonadales bacterium alter-6D02]